MYPIQCVADLHNIAKELNKEVKFVSYSYLDTACSRQGSDYRLTRQKTIYCFDEHDKFLKTRQESNVKKPSTSTSTNSNYAYKCNRQFKT